MTELLNCVDTVSFDARAVWNPIQTRVSIQRATDATGAYATQLT